MTYTYWLVKQGNEKRVYNWLHEHYLGINFWCDTIAIPRTLYEANTITGHPRFQSITRASVFWFEDFGNEDVNVKFKLMNADIILDHKHEKPNHVW